MREFDGCIRKSNAAVKTGLTVPLAGDSLRKRTTSEHARDLRERDNAKAKHLVQCEQKAMRDRLKRFA